MASGATEIIMVVAEALVGIGALVVVPLTLIVFRHQRQLAGVQRPVDAGQDGRIKALESEVHELRDRLNEQALLIDDHRRLSTRNDSQIKSQL